MEFRALGPIAAFRNGEEIDLGSPRQKAVLALLLVHHDEALPVDRILDELWGDESDGKDNALRVYVSRLRAALDPDRVRGERSMLETVGSGYRLNVDPDQYDVTRFERAVESGRNLRESDPEAAASTLRAALALWTGSPFEEFAYEEFVQLERHRLTELWIDTVEDRIDADLSTGLAGEVVSELEVLRERHPLRERLAGQQALALYRVGRPADALRSIDRFRRHVGDELGIEPSPRLLRLEEQILLHDERIQPRLPAAESLLQRPRSVVNPFKGLRPFGVDDAGAFFGRDALVAEMLRNLGHGQRLIALVGASGSGKSSVVRAGLIPALAKGAIEGSDQWLVATMVPGAHPFAELEAALLRSTIDGPASLDEQLRDGDAGLVRAALRVLPDNDSHVLLIIDQFEELFTLVGDDTIRDRFLSNLVAAVDDPHGRISVLVTLRADFYGQQLTHPQFGARLGAGVVNVTALTAEELEAAALQPAEQQGVAFEPALLGQLIADVGNQPGSLPLFQYALTELFDRRAGDALTAGSYRSMGGLEGALQRRAADLFDELDDEQREAARQLFLRLVVVGDDGHRTRRRVTAREVASLAVDAATMEHVIARFGEHRLLSFDSDHLTAAPTVEVAHEALLAAWPRLEGWIDESRNDLRKHASLLTALREWELADRRPDYLLTSARVTEFTDWERSSLLRLNEPELEYLGASAARVAEREAEEERRRRDEVRARRRLWTLVGVLATTLVVAGLFMFGIVGGSDPTTISFFGNRDDEGWNANIGSGLDRAARELGVEVVDVPWVVDPGVEMRALAESGPEIVISDSFGIGADPTILGDFPDIRFGIIDPSSTAENVTAATFANEEGAFLAGAAAALNTQTGTVGFIGAVPISLIEEFRAGFEAGVHTIDPDITVLATFVDPFNEQSSSGFADSDGGAIRARALYDRGADVVFSAAGYSGFGMFAAAAEASEASGQHLWAIGVDNDQWFDVPTEQQPHVLTSIIKRGDIAAFRLVEHILDEAPAGESLELGVADEGFTYSLQGGALSPETVAELDRLVAAVTSGAIEVPTVPSGPVLLLDIEGNEIDGPIGERPPMPRSVDGFTLFEPLDEGRYQLAHLGTPVSFTTEGEWAAVWNIAGHTTLGHPSSGRPGDRDVTFLRSHVLADPARPAAAPGDQRLWPATDIDGWFDNVIDGIVTSSPEAARIGGREAIYFEVEITDAAICGTSGYCVGFAVNLIDEQFGISGWAFEPDFHYRVWWIDQGDEAPLAVIASTPTTLLDFQDDADRLLATLEIGEPGPHPVDYEDSGIEN